MKKIYDYLGKEIKIGAHIIYCANNIINLAVVTNIYEDYHYRLRKNTFKLKIVHIFDLKEGNEIITCHKNATIVYQENKFFVLQNIPEIYSENESFARSIK